MVRKVIIIIVTLAAISSMTIAASAAPINTEYNEIAFKVAETIIANISFYEDYIFYNISENTYILATGSFSYDHGYNSLITNERANIYTITISNNNYTVENITVNQYQVDPEIYYVYSSILGYPKIIERGSRYEEVTIILLVIGLCIFLIRSIYNFTLRLRR